MLVLDTRSNMTSKYDTNFFIVIRHYKREDCETDADRQDARLIPDSKHIPITLVGMPYLVSLIYLERHGV